MSNTVGHQVEWDTRPKNTRPPPTCWTSHLIGLGVHGPTRNRRSERDARPARTGGPGFADARRDTVFQDYINTIDPGLHTPLPTMSSSMTDEEFQDLVLGVIRSL